jgi:acetyl-CoA carboxylase carboxyltransferase component
MSSSPSEMERSPVRSDRQRSEMAVTSTPGNTRTAPPPTTAASPATPITARAAPPAVVSPAAVALRTTATLERLRPHELLFSLFDDGSLELIRSRVEPGSLGTRGASGDGVIGGAGRINGRPVFAYAYDGSHAGGSLGVTGGYTITRVLALAERAGAPVVAFIESAGARVQEGASALGAFARIFHQIIRLRHTVPQIAVITGPSAGGAAYAPALMDWVIMVKGASMFLTGPSVVREAIGEQVGMQELGGHLVQGRNGVAHLVADDEPDALRMVGDLLGCLPQRAGALVPRLAPQQPIADTDPRELVPKRGREVYDMRRVVRAISDSSWFFELWPRWARNMLTGLCRLDGRVVGVVANQPHYLGGVIDSAASQKATRFIQTCDAYGIPLVVLVDTAGFMPGSQQEGAGIIYSGAELIRAFVNAAVPRLTVIVRKAYGGAYITMNSKDLGAHLSFAWPDAEIGVMSARSAAQIINRRRDPNDGMSEIYLEEEAAEYAEEHVSAHAAARRGLVDEVILPRDTRARLCWGLSVLIDE